MKKYIFWFLIIVVIILGIKFFALRGSANGSSDKWILSAMSPKNCENLQKEPSYPNSYEGDLIDTHIHIPGIPDGPFGGFGGGEEHPVMGVNVSIEDYVCMMDGEDTKMVFAFFPVWDPIIDESLMIVKKTMENYPGRFVPFIMPPDHDDRIDGFPTVDAATLQSMLAIYPKMFRGYGEIGLYERGDHGGPKGALALPPDSERLREIYPVVRENNLLVYVHLGEGQKESFEKALSENPDINFIWHGDQLIPYEEAGQNLKNIEDILYNHPNAYYGVDELYGDTWLLRPEITKEEFFVHFKNYESLLKTDLATWKGFIERHPNQVLWGTDRGWSAPWSLDEDVGATLTRYARAFIGRLDPSVQEKFAHKNAEKLSSSE